MLLRAGERTPFRFEFFLAWAGVMGRVKRAEYVPFSMSSMLSLPILDERYCRQYFDWVSSHVLLEPIVYLFIEGVGCESMGIAGSMLRVAGNCLKWCIGAQARARLTLRLCSTSSVAALPFCHPLTLILLPRTVVGRAIPCALRISPLSQRARRSCAYGALLYDAVGDITWGR